MTELQDADRSALGQALHVECRTRLAHKDGERCVLGLRGPYSTMDALKWLNWIHLCCVDRIGGNTVCTCKSPREIGLDSWSSSTSIQTPPGLSAQNRALATQEAAVQQRAWDALIPNQTQRHRHLPRPEQRTQRRARNAGALCSGLFL